MKTKTTTAASLPRTRPSQADLEIIQRLLYYPFGMALEGLGAWNAQPWQQYRYNGKERDTLTGWYEYGFRWYIDGIGRFTGVDPIADQFPWVSVYNYAENSPIRFIDYHGLQAVLPLTGEFKSEETTKYVSISAGYRSVTIPQRILMLSHEFKGKNFSVEYDPSGDNKMSEIGLKRIYNGKIGGLQAGFSGKIRALGVQFREASLSYSQAAFSANPDIAKNAEEISSEGHGKVFRHIAFQGLLSAVYGSDFAKEVGDFYERTNPNNPIEISYRDLINNGYGRSFGTSSKFDLSSKEGISKFLNKAANYVDRTFGLKSSGSPFTPDSQTVIDLHNTLNK